ncbi:MAG: adenylate kinase [Euryarchaeota archaeon]|nr:adenylate kinase [Euryarchaeota archaeon]
MEIPFNIAVVVGVPGVGKTTLCRKVSRAVGCNYVNYGDLMLEIAQKEQRASTDPEMFRLDMDVQHEIWKTAALKIRDMRNVLVDLHGLDQSKWGYVLSLPIEIISPGGIIVIIEASSENILKRRSYDESKKRIIENIKNIKEHMKLLRTSMAVCSAIAGCNFLILKNDVFDECFENMLRLFSKGYI